jgi:hypothetical protein
MLPTPSDKAVWNFEENVQIKIHFFYCLQIFRDEKCFEHEFT